MKAYPIWRKAAGKTAPRPSTHIYIPSPGSHPDDDSFGHMRPSGYGENSSGHLSLQGSPARPASKGREGVSFPGTRSPNAKQGSWESGNGPMTTVLCSQVSEVQRTCSVKALISRKPRAEDS